MRTLVCAIGRNENQYIREWVEYYKNIGFTNICLFDNNRDGEEYFEDAIEDYIDSDFVILKNYRNKTICQMEAYNECYNEYKDKYDWIAFFDCDEFLTFKDGGTIDEFLGRMNIDERGVEAFHFNWMIFGDSGKVDESDGPVLGRLTEPIPYDKKIAYDFPENNHIKTMVRCGLDIVWGENPNPTPHTPNAHKNDVICLNGCGNECDINSPFSPYDFSDAYIRHYSTKTANEYADKMKRGFPDQTWDGKRIKNLIETRFFRTNNVTPEKVQVFIDKLGVDLAYLLPYEKYEGEKSKDVQIFSLCFAKKNFRFLDNKYVTPLQVGAANGTDVCELKDNTGENVSAANFYYIENTGTFWIWKNIKDAKYKGQMQYRRPLVGINDNTDFDEIFKDHDVITCEPFHHPDHMKPTEDEPMVIPASTVEGGYAFSNCLLDLISMEKIVKHVYPEYSADWDKYIKNGPDLYYSNGFIMRSEDYDRYSEFLFNCIGLWARENKIDNILDLYTHVAMNMGAGKYIRYQNPYDIPKEAIRWQTSIAGFLSERLWTLWVQHNFSPDRIYKLPYNKMEEGMYT